MKHLFLTIIIVLSTLSNIFAQSTIHNGVIWNHNSPNASAWDLVNDVPIFMSQPDFLKDMKNYNQSCIGACWFADNSTRFVKDNSFNYNNFCYTEIQSAFQAGIDTNYIYQSHVGDIVLAKMRGTDNYVAIKVTNIEQVGSLYDISFEYKKNYYVGSDICIVTVDITTYKNMVIWEKKYCYSNSSFNIYKEVSLNIYNFIGNVPNDSAGYFIDYASVPESHGDKYKISSVDTFGNESVKSTFHKTMNLVISTFGSTMGLSWTPYEDESGSFIPDKYFIYRGTQPDNMQLLDSISASFTSYNDNNVFDSYYYLVGVRKPGGCNSTKENISESFSNKKLNFGSGINDYQIKDLSIYPNPANDKLSIDIEEKATLEIINSQGQIVDSKSLTEKSNNLDLSNLVSGVYTLRIKTDRGIAMRKLIKQ